MTTQTWLEGPAVAHDTAFWRGADGDLRVLFTGRGPKGERDEVIRRVAPEAPAVAWAKQVHGDGVLPGRPGLCGEGDAIVAPRAADLTLTIATADCVPVLLAGPAHLGAVHAGWRGLAAGVIAAAVRAIPEAPCRLTAWIGPAIGPCCYEVSADVAAEVLAATPGALPSEILRRGSVRPHLDLFAAAERQLRHLGIRRLSTLRCCTRCADDTLHSYRREGQGAGRNLAAIWVERATASA